MRCLVTGATGHIGSHLVRHLLGQNIEVMALVRPAATNLWRIDDVSNRLHIIKEDLSSIDNCFKEIKEFSPEIIIHLAWYGVGSRYRYDVEQINKNLYGSIKLLQLAHDCGCRRWICLGSQAEYGTRNGILKEELPAQPVTVYGSVKLCTYILANVLCKDWNIELVWLRLLASYGPMDDAEHLIPFVILHLLRGEKPALTLGEQRWDYLYVTDIADAIFKATMTPQAQGVFNLGSGKVYTVRGVAEHIRDLIDPRLPIGFGDVPYRPDQIMHLQADISRLKQATGWSPQVSLSEGLASTVAWFKENMWRYEQ